jgi:hypothetical protein
MREEKMGRTSEINRNKEMKPGKAKGKRKK